MSGPDLIIDDESNEITLPLSPVTVLDGDPDVPVITVYVPGPPGPPLIDVGSRVQPASVSTAIAAPQYMRQRSFIVGNGGPVLNPVIANPSSNVPWELFLFATDNTKTVTLEGGTNLLLSGQWIGRAGSILALQWDGQSQYVEVGRNEI